MSHYKYNRYQNRGPCTKCTSNTYSVENLERLATPRERHPRFMPDKPSPYWVDYVIDERPQALTNSQELNQYYQRFHEHLPRLDVLSRPKTTFTPISTAQTRPTTMCGIPKSALMYQPTDRIKLLAQPKPVKSAVDFPISTPSLEAIKTLPPFPKYPWGGRSATNTAAENGPKPYLKRSRFQMANAAIANKSIRLRSSESQLQSQSQYPAQENNVAVENKFRSARHRSLPRELIPPPADEAYAASGRRRHYRNFEMGDRNNLNSSRSPSNSNNLSSRSPGGRRIRPVTLNVSSTTTTTPPNTKNNSKSKNKKSTRG